MTDAADDVLAHVEAGARVTRAFTSPQDTRGWTVTRGLKENDLQVVNDATEVFGTPAGERYVRAQKGEVPDVAVFFPTRGLGPLNLVKLGASFTAKRDTRRARRERREQLKRERGTE